MQNTMMTKETSQNSFSRQWEDCISTYFGSQKDDVNIGGDWILHDGYEKSPVNLNQTFHRLGWMITNRAHNRAHRHCCPTNIALCAVHRICRRRGARNHGALTKFHAWFIWSLENEVLMFFNPVHTRNRII